MRVLITGASGMIGKGVLLECLDHPEVDQVHILVRTEMDVQSSKLTQIVHDDFSNYENIKERLIGFDACYLCMGVSAAGLSEEKYTRITYAFTLSLAKALIERNPKMTCIYVSGIGTDSTERGRTMWARVKGKTENDLLGLGFQQAFMFRPGAIIPLRGIKSRTKSYQFMYDYFMWLVKLIRFFSPGSVVNTTQIGLAMINSTRSGYARQIIYPKDMIVLSGS